MAKKESLTLKTLTKSNVWNIQENDVFRLWAEGEKDADLKDNKSHYLSILKSAFDFERVTIDKPEVLKKYELRGYKIGEIKSDSGDKEKWGVRKKPIMRVTDLTYENIHHITAAKLIEVLDRNFGGGWESLSQGVQDIIEQGFDVSTTTLPKDRLHKPGGIYEKKLNDGYEVLEISKGTWVEAIFVKVKPQEEHVKFKLETEEELNRKDMEEANADLDHEEEDENLPEEKDSYSDDDDDDSYDDEKLTEESYRTTYETNPEDLEMQAEDVSEDEEY